MFHDRDAGNAEHLGQLIRGHFERGRSRPCAGGGLRIGGRAGRVERHVAFDLLNDLMDVSVQYGHRAETAQLVHELVGVTRPPAPRLIDGPQRHMGKDHDRGAVRASLQVGRHPGELVSAQRAEATGLELQKLAALSTLASSSTQETRTYFVTDAQGSPVVGTDASGNTVWTEDYLPYGERRTNAASSSGNQRWFTAASQNPDTKLLYLGHRFMDPVQGRFVSIDPTAPSFHDGANFNRYWYANDDPMNKTDPSGTSCQMVGETQADCSVDHKEVPTGLNEVQAARWLAKVAAFEKQYTAAVNKLLADPKGTLATVNVPGHKAFEVDVGQVISRLILSEVTAEAGAGPLGDAVADSPSRNEIRLFDAALGIGPHAQSGLGQQITIVHEGIHWTGWGPMPDGRRSTAGELSVFGPGETGYGPERRSHSEPFDDAARRLLGN